VAELPKRQVLPRVLQAVSLKSRDEIIGKPDDFQIQGVGRKRGSGNLSEREVLAQFTDARLHASAAVIEMSDSGWRQVHVGHPSTVHITAEREQSGLGVLIWNESSRHYVATGLRPIMGPVPELCHLPLLVHRFIAQAGSNRLNAWVRRATIA
jgi:hypothetical protein